MEDIRSMILFFLHSIVAGNECYQQSWLVFIVISLSGDSVTCFVTYGMIT